VSKHRDHLIAERVHLNPAMRDVKSWHDLDFLEREGELLGDDAFDEYLKSGKPLPYSVRNG
jgi:hypothetical protein